MQQSAYTYQRMVVEQQLIEQANAQMTKISITLLNSGRARDTAEAVQLACREHGPGMASALQESLRNLGAKDIIITCP